MAYLESDASSVISTTTSESSSPSSSFVTCDTHRSKVQPNRGIGLMDLFGVQLEVTGKLLHAEQKKLKALERELNARLIFKSVGQQREVEQLKVNISRIQQQHDQLDREYQEATIALLKKSNKLRRSSRSQPAIGLRQANKTRPSIFGTLTSDLPSESGQNQLFRRTVTYPQKCVATTVMTDMSDGGVGGVPLTNGYHHGNGQVVDNAKDALVYQDSELMSGSLDALIQHLVPTKQYYPDRTYIFAFLLSSRLFTQPYQLLQRVCQTCIYQQNLMAEHANKETLGRFGPHIIRLLNEWTDNFAYDFRDERMMHGLKDMTQRLVAINSDLRKDVGILMHNLLSKLSSLQKYEDLLSKINSEIAQRLINIMPNTDIYEVCSNPLVLAQQLTHIELERLSMIGPEEFVQAFAKETEVQHYKDMKKTSNLESYVQWFNRLSFFVATEICMHLKKKKVPTATLR